MRIKMISFMLAALLTLSFNGCQKENPHSENTAVSPSSDSITSGESETTAASSASDNTVGETTAVTSQEEFEESAGGNTDSYVQIEITVSDNQYFYNNHEIIFDEIRELLKDADTNTNVVIYDELASSSSFKQLTDYLDANEIPYSME